LASITTYKKAPPLNKAGQAGKAPSNRRSADNKSGLSEPHEASSDQCGTVRKKKLTHGSREPYPPDSTVPFVLFVEKTNTTANLMFEGLLDPDIRPPFHKSGIWLVRPDGHVGCSSGDVDAIRGYLEEVWATERVQEHDCFSDPVGGTRLDRTIKGCSRRKQRTRVEF
jgi:hypothetical protein